jgi:hypothetical protein
LINLNQHHPDLDFDAGKDLPMLEWDSEYEMEVDLATALKKEEIKNNLQKLLDKNLSPPNRSKEKKRETIESKLSRQEWGMLSK